MKNYRLYYKKLPRWYDPEQVFLNLYADKKYSFWLNNKDYSYMGIASKRIKYTLSNHTISISNNGKTQKLRQDIFTYLQKELLNWKGVASVGAPSMRVVPLGELPVERLDSPIGEEAVGLGKRETGPRPVAKTAIVPIKSSASYPSSSKTATFIFASNVCKIPTCGTKSSAIFGLCCWYPAYIACRKVGFGLSKQTIRYSGFKSLMTVSSIEKNPYTPFTTSPLVLVKGGKA
jgi:hypothetical protein